MSTPTKSYNPASRFKVVPPLLADAYKLGHPFLYDKGVTRVYSNSTARMSRIPGIEKVVALGLQPAIQMYLHEQMRDFFFDLPKDEALAQFKHVTTAMFGPERITVDHFSDLHDLGYVPMEFRSIPEGTLVDLGVPHFTMDSTRPNFGWITNSWETLLSCSYWPMSTSATTARLFRAQTLDALRACGAPLSLVEFMNHDFSLRGMMGVLAGMLSGTGHLTQGVGTDTVPAIPFIEHFYDIDATKHLVGTSVLATEHAIMTQRGPFGEFSKYEDLLRENPFGVLAIVSDTYNLWKVICEYLPRLKELILARKSDPWSGAPGRLMIRPDSGDPIKIVCGDPDATPGSPEYKGVIELLWEVFGGEERQVGKTTFEVLHPQIGCVYGDGITLDRQRRIFEGLMAKGFSVECMVFGLGSFTYALTTRDVFGHAVKATLAEIDGKLVSMQKDPVTDKGKHSANKKSHRGFLRVEYDPITGSYSTKQDVTEDEMRRSLLVPTWRNGEFIQRWNWLDVVERAQTGLKAV